MSEYDRDLATLLQRAATALKSDRRHGDSFPPLDHERPEPYVQLVERLEEQARSLWDGERCKCRNNTGDSPGCPKHGDDQPIPSTWLGFPVEVDPELEPGTVRINPAPHLDDQAPHTPRRRAR